MSIAAVVIGRNEGARLIACLDGLRGVASPVIYVDSGSTDGSVAAARARGADVVTLDLTRPFTAARARNAGIAALPVETEMVQFLDGDCQMRPDWIVTARRFLDAHKEVAVVCGRRREQHPEASVFNRLIDSEWDTPVGETKACGGDALMRLAPLREVGGYREDLIAGEEPELCVRLRHAGWKVWRLDADMTLHDAKILRFSQWWKRMKRAGYAFAAGARLHGAPPERHWVKETRRAVFWGLALPAAILAGFLVWWPLGLGLTLIYPLQVLRLARRGGLVWAGFTVLGKVPEGMGVLSFYWREMRGGQARIIEYK